MKRKPFKPFRGWVVVGNDGALSSIPFTKTREELRQFVPPGRGARLALAVITEVAPRKRARKKP